MSVVFSTNFCHFPIKIKVKIQNEILRVKKTKEKIFIGKKGVSISCRRTVECLSNVYL